MPINDRFAKATKLSGKKGKKVSSNAGAGRERKEPRKIAGKKAGQSIWYVYRAKRAGQLTIDLSGSRFNTVLGVFTGAKVKKLHKVAADDNGGKGKSSRVSFRVAKGTKYRIVVAGVKQADGKPRATATGTTDGTPRRAGPGRSRRSPGGWLPAGRCDRPGPHRAAR